MPTNPNPSAEVAGLRHRAETRVREQRPDASPVGTEADTLHLVHELQVHQVELEMQNDELHQAQNAMEAGLEKYGDLYDFAPVGYLTLDREGTIREANLASASLLGLPRSRLVERRLALHVADSDQPAFNAFLTRVFASKVRECCEVTLPKEGKDPVAVRIEAVAAASGRECRAVLEDMSELKRAEAALRESEAWCRTFFESSSDGLFCLSLSGEILRVNGSFARMHGYSVEELLKTNLRLLDTPETAQLYPERMRLILAGKSLTFEVEHCHQQGHTIPLEVTANLITVGGKNFVLASHRDLTERRRAEADRLILNKLESTAVLVGGIAHDYNNLLTAILLNLELARTLVPPADEFLARRLQAAEQAALLAQDLTRQLVAAAQGNPPVRKTTALPGLIHLSVQSALNGSPVRCEYALGENLWLAEVDANQLGQALRNLVLNAREAMPRGGVVSVRAENVVLSTTATPGLPPGEYVRVSIADQGSGIAKEVLPKIFDPYFSTKQRGNVKGMGLGLTICHAILQKHDGAITVESTVGVGTTFHLYLPASRRLIGGDPATRPQALSRPSRILVMDDEEWVRDVVGQTLQRMGHEVALAEDGQRAIELYTQAKELGQPFDLVILDLTVRTGLGGEETLQALLQIDPAVKAIVMSGYADHPTVQEPKHHGFAAALKKPFDTGKLQDVLAGVIGRSAATHD